MYINGIQIQNLSVQKDEFFQCQLEPAFKDNPEVGTVGIYEKYTRLTFVCYLRQKIVNCPDEVPERILKSLWSFKNNIRR